MYVHAHALIIISCMYMHVMYTCMYMYTYMYMHVVYTCMYCYPWPGSDKVLAGGVVVLDRGLPVVGVVRASCGAWRGCGYAELGCGVPVVGYVVLGSAQGSC